MSNLERIRIAMRKITGRRTPPSRPLEIRRSKGRRTFSKTINISG